MRFDHLVLSNFRGFERFEIDFDQRLTMLLGGNMAGKTAVLEGAAIALGRVIAMEEFVIRRIESRDVRRTTSEVSGIAQMSVHLPTVVEGAATRDGRRYAWDVVRRSLEDPDSSRLLPHLEDPIRNAAVSDRALPIIACYGTQRGWRGRAGAPDLRGPNRRTDGYLHWYDIVASDWTLAGWMRKQTLVELQRGSGYKHPQLAAVERAVLACISDVVRFWFDIEYDELRLERTSGDIQSFAMLSEGYRNMVAMVADIAWRAAVLNPQHGEKANELSDGVVLIDEIDLHLHPSWQRRVVGDLLNAFPRIQFIMTTHSPQVIATVSRHQVRVLEKNLLVATESFVEGRDSNELLEDVFGVAARPQAAQQEIDDLYRLIEVEDFDAARHALAALEERLGANDAAITRARWMLDSESSSVGGSSLSQ